MKRLQICTVVYWKCLNKLFVGPRLSESSAEIHSRITHISRHISRIASQRSAQWLGTVISQSAYSVSLPLKIKNDFSRLLSRHSMLLGDIMQEFDRNVHRLKPSSNSGATLHITGFASDVEKLNCTYRALIHGIIKYTWNPSLKRGLKQY